MTPKPTSESGKAGAGEARGDLGSAGESPRRPVKSTPHLASEGHDEGPFSLYRIVAQLPTTSWGYHFSRAHPDLRIELLNRIETAPGQLLTEIRMIGRDAPAWSTESRRYSQVRSVSEHVESPDTVLYRVTFQSPSIHEVTQRHRVLTRYPIVIQNGWSRFETFGSATQMRAYLAELAAGVGPSRIEAVRQGSVSRASLGLTPVQDEIFRAAVSTGYYAAPRRISVTGLARRLGRSKSTVSTALVRIQKQLADSALRLDIASFASGV